MARRDRGMSAPGNWIRRKQLGFEKLEARLPLAADFAGDAGLRPATSYEPPPSAVYAPDIDPSVMQLRPDALAANNNGERISNFQFSDNSRWSVTATNGGGLTQGDPTTITWSIVPDGTPISGFNGEAAAPSNLVSFLGSIYGVTTADANLTDEPWFGLFQSYLNRWSALSGMTYVFEPNDDGVAISSFANVGLLGVRGDIRISGHNIDGNSNILAYNFFPNGGDMVIDTGDANFYGNTANNSRALRNVLAHENGHGLGLDHVCPVVSGANGRLMEPFINLSIDGPQFDDILAMQRGYGDVLEKNGGNNTAPTATPLGALLGGQTIVRGADAVDIQVAPAEVDFVSIDDNSDVDYFSFTIGSGMGANIDLTPLGATYLSGPQNANGSCSSGTSFNASRQSDLTLQLIGTDGSTVLKTSNTGGLGAAESISSGLLTAGTYYVRVAGSANAAQMYRLSIAGEQTTGVTIIETDGGTTVYENGAVDTYRLSLASSPVGTVQIKVTADAQSSVSTDGVNFSSTAVLSFSNTVPQTITVRAANDTLSEGVHTSLLTHAITATNDPVSYPLNLFIPALTVNVVDDELAPFVRRANLGGLIASSDNNSGVLSGPSDQVDFMVLLSAGQTVAASATASGSATLSLTLVNVTNLYSSPNAGAAAVLPTTPIVSTGLYRLRVTANIATGFNLRAIINASLEAVDTSAVNRLNLGPSAVSGSPGTERLAVIGTSTPTSNPLQFATSSNPSFFVDIAGTGTPLNLDDDGVAFISSTVGNSLFPAGTVTVSNNGGMATGNVQQFDFNNVVLPTNQFNTALLPFWDDLDATNGNVYWEQRTIGGKDALVVQWDNRPHYDNFATGTVTFQAQVFASGPVLATFVYQDVDFGNAQYNSGISATIGYQSSSTSALTYSFNTKSLNNGTVLELLAPVVPDVDIFEFDLSDQVGKPIDIVLTGLSSDFSGQILELLAPDGTTVLATGSTQPLQSGVVASNLDVAIVNFVIPSAGKYMVRVSSEQAGEYGLVFAKSLTLDIEPNNLPTSTLRDVTNSRRTLGYLSTTSDSEDRYQINLQQGQTISLASRTPFSLLPATPLNDLNPELSVIAADGQTVLASDQDADSDGKNAFLLFVAPSTGVYTIRVAATAGSGEYALAIGPGVAIDDLYVNSTTWMPFFRDYIDGGFNDDQAFGFRVTNGSKESIPWRGLDEIKLRFNSDVGDSLSVGDFNLTGQYGWDSHFVPGVVPAIASVAWDADSYTATLQLSVPLGPNRVRVTALAAGIQNSDGWVLSADQTFTIFVLEGDAVDAHAALNGQYNVNGEDWTFIRYHLSSQLIDLPGIAPLDGAYFGYDLRADVNGDGYVNGVDSLVVRDRWGWFVIDLLPPPSVVIEPTSSSLLEGENNSLSPTASVHRNQRRLTSVFTSRPRLISISERLLSRVSRLSEKDRVALEPKTESLSVADLLNVSWKWLQ